jgi:hypothetical protein
LLQEYFAQWRRPEQITDEQKREIAPRMVASIEAVWICQNKLYVRFGAAAVVCEAYEDLLTHLEVLRVCLGKWIGAGDSPAPAHQEQRSAHRDAYVRSQKRFVVTVRKATALQPGRNQRPVAGPASMTDITADRVALGWRGPRVC